MTKKYGIDLDEFNNEVYEAAKEFTEQQKLSEVLTPEDIKFVFDVMKKEAPYDEVSIKQLFYGCSSAFTKIPIHHNINSRKSGSGKSYILILVSSYFPNRYVLSFVGMSDKALVHEQGMQVIVDEESGNTVLAEPVIEDLQKKIVELETKIGELEDKIDDTKVTRDKKMFTSQKKVLMKQKRSHETEIKDIYKKCEKLIILDNRIILMLDTAQEGLYNTLMSMISQDTTRDQIYQFTDKQSSGKLGATKNRLRGTPALFTTQVIDDTRQVRYQEKNRRFIHVTPDTSREKIFSAKKLIGQRYGLLPEEYDKLVVDSADKERAREVVSLIVAKLIDHSKLLKPKESGVKIPFAESLNYGIAGNETEWSMTVMDRTIRYIAIITKVNMDSRPRFIDTETGKFYPISTFTDLKETLQLMRNASSILRPYISYWYNKVFLPRFKELGGQPNAIYTDSGFPIEKEPYVGLTTEQLATKTFDVMKTPMTTYEIRKQYLYPLSNLGIINIVKSSINGNELICFPVEDGNGNIFNIFNDEQDLRLEINNLNLFPGKDLLEESFRPLVKHDDKKRGTKNNFENFEKYAIIDHEGHDITVEELVDKYLSDPWTCFKNKELEDMAKVRMLCSFGIYPVRHNNEDKNENNLYPSGCRRDLTKIYDNVVEQFTNGEFDSILEASETPHSLSKQPDFANTTANATVSDQVTSDKNAENRAQNYGASATNATLHTGVIGEEQEPDRSLAETTRLLKNLREEYYEYQCNNCHYKEAAWKNSPRPSSCPKCKSLGFLSSTKSIFPVQDEAAFVERGGDNK